MALCGKVDDSVNILLPEQCKHCIEVTDVHLYESVVRPVLDVLEIGKVAGVGQLVQVDDSAVGVFVYKKAYNMGSDESGTSGYDYCLHLPVRFFMHI